MVALAGREATRPALATETSCCSITSRRLWWSAPILSNSSTQQTPWSAITTAPASRQNSPVPPSLPTDAVSPVEVLMFPVTYTPRCDALHTALSIWLFPIPGSPTIRTWASPLSGALDLDPLPAVERCFLEPPKSARTRPAFSISLP